MLDDLKIAIVCDWLTVYAGAERVVYEIHQLFPKAPIFTTLYSPKQCPVFKNADVRESKLRFIPGARRFHRLVFPLMPRVFESFDLSDYDLVISSSHSAAKGVITKPETLHVSYCHSPMRYVWDQSHSYQQSYKAFSALKFFYRPILHKVRLWDRMAADRVDLFIANSNYIKRRIRKYYDRDAEVVWPPVDLSFFTPSNSHGSAYIAVGRLIPYKRFDLAVRVANKMKLPLKIIGTGPELSRLKKIAGPTVEFLGNVTDQELLDVYQNAKALLYPQVEDFGIVPLESMAAGTPVIALKKGGAMETVTDKVSGLFFEEQTLDSLEDAVKRFEKMNWDPEQVSDSVEKFSNARFKSELLRTLEIAWKEHQDMLA